MNKFGSINEYSDIQARLRNIAIQLRSLRKVQKYQWDEPADHVIKESNISGKPVTTLSITLTPTGCAWAKKGGCTMCGEYDGSTHGKLISSEDHIAQFACAISKYYPLANPQWLRIYQEGNYNNNNEFHRKAQQAILTLSSLLSGIERITIESMARYLTEADNVIYLKKSIVRDIDLEIGMGFEAKDNIVRNVCINKGESLNIYKKAIKNLKDHGILSLAYVVLKPPFLTEKESIDEAIETINYANEIGFNAISLEPLSIHRSSLVHALYLNGDYEPPWLWSVIEVAKNINKITDFRIGGSGFYPRPLLKSHNRPHNVNHLCNDIIWEAIKNYGRTRDISIFDHIECDCKAHWKTACEYRDISLKDRMENKIKNINIDKYKNHLELE